MNPEGQDYYRALYEVARTVNSTLQLPEVLDLAVTYTARALGAKACSLRLLTPTREQLEISAVYGLSEAYVAKGPVRVSGSLVDAEALDGRSVQVFDAGQDPRLQYPEEAAREGIASILVVPVIARSEAIGVLRIYTSEPHEFGHREVEFAEIIANLTGLAIENAREYGALQEQFGA